MKILHIINSLATGGAEKLLLETLPLYNSNGITADLLVLNGANHPFLTKLQSLRCCQVFSLGTSSVYNPLNIFKIIPYLKKYDILHVHLFPAQYWVVIAKLITFSKTKLIFTEHSTSNRRIRGNIVMKYIDKLIYRQYARIICITDKVRKVMQEHTNIESPKFRVIQNGVDTNAIQIAKPLHKSNLFDNGSIEDKILIQVSSFQEPKDQKTLIKAMSLLPTFCKLVLVGVGPVKIECETLAADLGLQNRVLFLGARMDVPELLKSADIVVLSSKYEGLSLSSIEGMASGNPFVASAVPGLTEVVKGAGVLFPQGDEARLAKEISNLLNDPDYYNTVASACQQRAAEYDIHKMVDQHLTLYKDVAKN